MIFGENFDNEVEEDNEAEEDFEKMSREELKKRFLKDYDCGTDFDGNSYEESKKNVKHKGKRFK